MNDVSEEAIREGLAAIRTKRWMLWSVFLTYIPAIALTFKLGGSDRAAGVVLVLWLVLAAVTGVRVAFSRCPRCGNLFHMDGYMTRWPRRCLHCQLGLKGEN